MRARRTADRSLPDVETRSGRRTPNEKTPRLPKESAAFVKHSEKLLNYFFAAAASACFAKM